MNAQTLGWTLIHSLWQGFLIYLLLKAATRVAIRSDVRYGLGVGALGLMFICSVATFLVLNTAKSPGGFELILNADQASNAVASSGVFNWIDQNIIWLLRFWALGFAVGMLRIATGLWYIRRLRRSAHPVQDEWLDMVKRLSDSLNINRVVAMAEAGISSPMVVGFMKPIILFPVGLLSGLTTEQVETILVHELSHIRRQDYIINLVQSIVETIFFFNPFALLMSSMIREERENCCDDMVIAKGISPISYVRTLAQLEASRSSSKLALGFAGNQNQLLNRIKRIMENSAKNDWGKGRLMPVALLILGLVCASWLSISSEKELSTKKPVHKFHKAVAQDTSKEDGLVVIRKRKSYGTWVEAPAPPPMEEIPGIDQIPGYNEIPGIEFIPEIPGVDMEMFSTFEMPPNPDVAFSFEEFADWDSIPGVYFRTHDGEDWEEFEREFTEKFKSEFKEFYNKNQGQFNKMMEDMRKDESKRREAYEVVDLADMRHKADMENIMTHDMVQALKQTERMAAKIRAEAPVMEQQSRQMMKMQADQWAVQADQLRQQSLIVEDMARKTDEYKSALTELLIEDGYIKQNDDLDPMNFTDVNGKMTINGVAIKDADAIKYRALRDTYFRGYKRMSRDSYGRNE